MLRQGDTFVLDSDPAPGDATRVHLPHPEILAALEPGHTLLLDDGKVRLTAIEIAAKRDRDAGRGRRQAVRPQGRQPAGHDHPDLGADAPKDRSDLEAALDAGIDWIALSFIQRPKTSPRPRRSRAAAPPSWPRSRSRRR